MSNDFVEGVDHHHFLGEMNTGSQDYDQTYYDEYAGNPYDVEAGWMTMFRSVAKHIVQSVEPCGNALDAGCAKGFLVEALAELGVDSEGIDISEHAVNAATAEVRPRLRVGSLTEPFGKRYDVITCIEVLEHMPFADSELAIDNICAATDQIVFSSTPRDYREPTHINVRRSRSDMRAPRPRCARRSSRSGRPCWNSAGPIPSWRRRLRPDPRVRCGRGRRPSTKSGLHCNSRSLMLPLCWLSSSPTTQRR